MSIFSRIIPGSGEKEAARRNEEIRKQVEQHMQPVQEIGRAVIDASNLCLTEIKPLIQTQDTGTRGEIEADLFNEFVCFFIHMTHRHPYSRLTQVQSESLSRHLCPIVAGTAPDSVSPELPPELKEKLKSEFYERLGEAELAYTATCGLPLDLPEDMLVSGGNDLLSVLAKRVAGIIRVESNPLTAVTVRHATTDALVEVRLNEFIKQALPALDYLAKASGTSIGK